MTLKLPYMSFLAIFKFDLEWPSEWFLDVTLRVTLIWQWVTLVITLNLGGDLELSPSQSSPLPVMLKVFKSMHCIGVSSH